MISPYNSGSRAKAIDCRVRLCDSMQQAVQHTKRLTNET